MRINRIAAAVLALTWTIPAAAAATSSLPDQASVVAEAARAQARGAAEDILAARGEGRGLDPDRAKGVARAAEVSQSWRFTGAEKPGNGPKSEGNGSDRSAEVHAALAVGLSPSAVHNPEIGKPGAELAAAFNKFKAKRDGHPGQGQGRGLGGPGGDD